MPFDSSSASIFYRLLTARRYRAVRHLLLTGAILAVSLGQTLGEYGPYAPTIGNSVYFLCLVNAAIYLLTAYYHIYWLAPHDLVRKRYSRYLFLSAGTVALVLLFRIGERYAAGHLWDLPAVRLFSLSALPDLLSDFAVNMLCFTGVSLTVLFRRWLREENAVAEWETRKLANEVDALKEIVDPQTLLDTLHRCGDLCGRENARSADMILRLSGLLRYQLYEGRKKKVLLAEEVNFLRAFLELGEIRSGTAAGIAIEERGDVLFRYVPPLSFAPLVGQLVRKGAQVRHTSTEEEATVSDTAPAGEGIGQGTVSSPRVRFTSTGQGVTVTGGTPFIYPAEADPPALGRMRFLYGERLAYRRLRLRGHEYFYLNVCDESN